MAMQPHAWMTSYLFNAWISQFIESIWRLGSISHYYRHLFILDGHGSHMTLEVARAIMEVGLDLLSMLHTHHMLSNPLILLSLNLLSNIFVATTIFECHEIWSSVLLRIHYLIVFHLPCKRLCHLPTFKVVFKL